MPVKGSAYSGTRTSESEDRNHHIIETINLHTVLDIAVGSGQPPSAPQKPEN